MRTGVPESDGWSGLEGLLALRDRLHAFARTSEGISEAVAFGSTERADRPADDWSDLDLLFVVDDTAPWLADLGWTDAIGPSWLRFVHPAPIDGVSVVQVLFDGGYDVDLIPVDPRALQLLGIPDVAAEVLGAGARVIRGDGTGPLAGIAAASTAPSMRRPTPAAYDFTVQTFLYQACWAVKRLRRGELWRAWDDHACYLRGHLRTMLEWQALARGTAGVNGDGRRLERWLGEDMATLLPGTVAAYDPADLGATLPPLVDAFCLAAREVAAANGLPYPDGAEAHVRAWIGNRLLEREARH